MQVLTSSQRSNQMVLYLMATAELQCCTAPDQADSIKIQPRARSHTLCCLPVVSSKYKVGQGPCLLCCCALLIHGM
jgi:hypothetical protein